ncbi:MAG: lactate utilization protein [Porticoccaceae bacterium]|nr:lactate utilization protein [Porticoccaceae bacterium]
MTANSVLQAISGKLARTPLQGEALEQRFASLKKTASPPVPAAVNAHPLTCFREQGSRNAFQIRDCDHPDPLVATLAQQPMPIVLSPQREIAALNWSPVASRLTCDYRAPAIAVVFAVAAIAETGTVAIRTIDVPSAMLFLSEELIIIVNTKQIVACQDDLWKTISLGDYRALHLISGPSRTADVEQTLQVGAHGPKRVELWLISESGL